MNKVLNAFKDKQLVGIIFIIIALMQFIILSFLYNYTISIPILITFGLGVYLLLKYSTKWKG